MSDKYWWFQGETVKELCAQLEAAGVDSCRLEVHPVTGGIVLQVIPADAQKMMAQFKPLNHSNECPPFC